MITRITSATRVLVGLAALGLAASSCTTVGMGPKHFQTKYPLEFAVGGYASAREIRKYDGEIVQIDIISNKHQQGEILNVDIWPVVGVGVGLIGLRLHVFMLGGGLGSLMYIPESVGDKPEMDADFKWPDRDGAPEPG